jgi:histidinol-phosphatase (PHP family)
MEDMCQAALELGMEEIAITDHADYEPLDVCSDYFRPEPYWQSIERCRNIFDGRLTIRAGVECGETHLYREEVGALISTYDYDVVIGSLHWAGDRPAFDGTFFDGLTLDEGLLLYFDHLTRLAADGEYDLLGHIDLIRRATDQRFGLPELNLELYEAQARALLRTVAERGKGIEVNTSYVFKGLGEPGPSTQVLRWFREEGGEIITLGSDGHYPDQVGAAFDRALDIVREAGFDQVTTFHGRSPIRTPLPNTNRRR